MVPRLRPNRSETCPGSFVVQAHFIPVSGVTQDSLLQLTDARKRRAPAGTTPPSPKRSRSPSLSILARAERHLPSRQSLRTSFAATPRWPTKANRCYRSSYAFPSKL
jgi:hypothetical protein